MPSEPKSRPQILKIYVNFNNIDDYNKITVSGKPGLLPFDAVIWMWHGRHIW